MFRFLTTIFVGAIACQATIADVRFGSHACIVEEAFAFNPNTGESVPWTNPQRSFVLRVENCTGFVWSRALARLSETEAPSVPDGCQGVDTGSTITTSLKGLEAGWSNEFLQVSTDADFAFSDSGDAATIYTELEKYASQLKSVPATYTSRRSSLGFSPTLRIEPELRFYLMTAGNSEHSENFLYFSASGQCAQLE